MSQDDLPWAIEAGSLMEDAARASPTGSLLRFARYFEGAPKFLSLFLTISRTVYDSTLLAGLCGSSARQISEGLFAQLCYLSEVQAIVADDFTATGE